MHADQPSHTAWLCAMARARHQFLDGGVVFTDPLAARILGPAQAAAMAADPGAGEGRIGRMLRGALAARSRIAEDTLADAVLRGAGQCVLLGAGLDTFALRNPWPERLRVFEVDHPATQAWKRRLVADAGLAAQGRVTWVPVDFEQQEMFDVLRASGWCAEQATVVVWLGVTVYLTPGRVAHSLRQMGQALAPGSVLVFDFVRRPARWRLLRRLMLAGLSRRYRRFGEPWQSYLQETELRRQLGAAGFQAVEVLDAGWMARHWLAGQPIPPEHRRLGEWLGGVVRAWR
ncbi:MAG TPA: SAM-dependent methyltransferase [Burkholderiaceae bacterium]|nr:SAM-dependent methyltransferase [Burkholderiaceae bacterium]